MSTTRSEGVQPGRSALVEIGQQRQHPLLRKGGQGGVIARPVVDRGVVEFVIAHVHDQSLGGVDAQPHTVGDRVAHVEEFDLKRANSLLVAGLNGAQVGLLGHAVAGQLDLEHADGQRRGVNRRVDKFQHVAKRAGVIFVTVRDNNTDHLVAALLDVTEIGDNVINPDHVIFGEHEPGVNDQDLPVIFVQHHVAPDFP